MAMANSLALEESQEDEAQLIIAVPEANSFSFLNSEEDEAQLIERVSAKLKKESLQKKKEKQQKAAGNENQKKPVADQNAGNVPFGELQRRNIGFQRQRQRPTYNNGGRSNGSQWNRNRGSQQWVEKDKEKEMKTPSENGSDDSWQQQRSRKGRRAAAERDQERTMGNYGYYQGSARGSGKGANFRLNNGFVTGDHDAGSEFTSSGKNGSFDGDGRRYGDYDKNSHREGPQERFKQSNSSEKGADPEDSTIKPREKPPPPTYTLQQYEKELLKKRKALEALKKTSEERVVNPDEDYFSTMKLIGKKKSQQELVKSRPNKDKRAQNKVERTDKDKKPVRKPTTLTIDDFLKTAPKGRRMPPTRDNKKQMEVPQHKTTENLEEAPIVVDPNDSDFPVLRAPQRA